MPLRATSFLPHCLSFKILPTEPNYPSEQSILLQQIENDYTRLRSNAPSGWAVYHRPMDAKLFAVTAFILAGGKSTRMGADKAFVTLSGRSLLERMLELGHSVTRDVRIIGNAQKFSQFAPTVEDVFQDCGPLGGIHAALRASSTELNVILAVDLPFVSPALLQYLIARAERAPGKRA